MSSPDLLSKCPRLHCSLAPALQRLNVTRISRATVSKDQPIEDAGRIGSASIFDDDTR
jgi:hypothetical protein